MILPDTSIWIDHLRLADQHLSELLAANQVVAHDFVTGEVALGSIATRIAVIAKLSALPQIRVASPVQVATLIEAEQLWGRGIGYVDAQLLASARLVPATRIWTRDKRLLAQANRLGIAYAP